MATANSSSAKKLYMAVIALTSWFALILQFYIMLENAPANNIPLATTIINYFSFFTILTNILVALTCTVPLLLPSSNAGKFFSRYSTQSGVALFILIVGAIYSIALRHIWSPQGWQKVADMLLHDVVPVLFILFWFIFVPKGVLQWKDAFPWLIYPFVYLIYSLIRGAFTDRYPYYFIDAKTLGYSKAFLNIAGISVAFLAAALLLIGINRLLARRSVSVQS